MVAPSRVAVVEARLASTTLQPRVTGGRRKRPLVAGAVIETTGAVLSTRKLRVDVATSLWLPEASRPSTMTARGPSGSAVVSKEARML
jgi:hypothetical protein